jgi:uncharacterized protein YbjT (DUF2867 family)
VALREHGVSVRLLLRPGSEAPSDHEVVRGDMMVPASLNAAFKGIDAVVSTAAGYTKSRKGDSIEIDYTGNQNLAHAAKRAGISRYVLLSILSCERAKDVPHFWAKSMAEKALFDAGVPFVSVRAGGFLDQSINSWRRTRSRTNLSGSVIATVRVGHTHTRQISRGPWRRRP